MKLLYFTSTGNCLSVAKQFSGELISIPQAAKRGEYSFSDKEAIGLIFPVYGLSVPPYILGFIEKAKFQTEYLFAVLSYGTYAAGAPEQLERIAGRHGIWFDYINILHMNENYLPGFKMSDKNVLNENALNTMLEDVKHRKHSIKRSSFFDRFMTKAHQRSYRYNIGEGLTEKYSISDKCVGCGICAKVCPTDNITLSDGKPVFGNQCLSCLACTQNCPQNAIRLSSEKSEKRYRNSSVTLEEIIEANN